MLCPTRSFAHRRWFIQRRHAAATNPILQGFTIVWVAFASLYTAISALALVLTFVVLFVVRLPINFAEDSISPDSPFVIKAFMVAALGSFVLVGLLFVAVGRYRLSWHRRKGRRLPKMRRPARYEVAPVSVDASSSRVS